MIGEQCIKSYIGLLLEEFDVDEKEMLDLWYKHSKDVPLTDPLYTYKVPYLKEILKKHKLPVSGSKDVLLQRIKNNNVYINYYVKFFIDLITKEFDILEQDLIDVWIKSITKNITNKSVKESFVDPVPPSGTPTNDLKVYNKVQLQDILKQLGLPVSGTKSQLIARIESGKSKCLVNVPIKKTTPKKKKLANVLEHLLHTKKQLNVRRNKFNNYEDIDTGLVFDEISKKVIGVQNNDGTIGALTEEDIEVCRENGFEYEVPETF